MSVGGMNMVDINKKIGARLRCFREEKGLTVGQMSSILGITDAHYRRLEKGEHDVRAQKIYDLYMILNIDPHYLITGERRGEKMQTDTGAAGMVIKEPSPVYAPRQRDLGSTPNPMLIEAVSVDISKPIIFSAGYNRYPVAIDDILYLESVNRAVVVHTTDELLRIPSLRLGAFMEQYGKVFVRIHRTIVVNKTKIRRYNNCSSFVEIEKTGEKLHVGRSYCENVRKAFDENRNKGYNG